MEQSRHPPRRSRRRLASVLLGTMATLVAVALALGWVFGPRFGLYLVPPSAQRYADVALTEMDRGYYAQGPQWDAARNRAVEATRNASTYAQTLPALREALAVAGGNHSHLFESGESLASTATARPLPQATTNEGITTLTVPELVADDQEFLQRYSATLTGNITQAEEATTCGWIVDARDNTGGNMSPMLEGLHPLLGDGVVGGFEQRDGTRTQIALSNGTVNVGHQGEASSTASAHSGDPVAVLQGPRTASSGEVVLIAFKGRANTRSFGTPTAGYSSGNQTIRLYDGTEMLLTMAVLVDRDGNSFDGGPVPADEHTSEDNAEQTAKAWLRTQC